MSGSTPTISVSLVTYNHERYVAEAIRSILDQTFTDFELIVVDDGSTDDTPRIIASFADPRIVSIRQPNGGPSVAANRALAACRGQYVALMTGDDVSMPHRLQVQLDAYRRGGPRLLFAASTFIDDAGQPLAGGHFAAAAFDTTPRSQVDIYRRLFDGNFVNAVTGFTELRLLREAGQFDPSLYLLQDHQMWIDFVKKWPIEFLTEPVLRYRIRGDGGNLSAPTPATYTRHDNEFCLIMRGFFDGVSDEMFRAAFHGDLRRPDLASPLATRCEQALLFLRAVRPELVYVGLERARELFRDPAAADMLARDFHYPHAAFVERLKTFDPLGRYCSAIASTLYVDTGAGCSEADSCCVYAPNQPTFLLTFDLARFPSVKTVRWDPLEKLLCRVRLERVSWTDADGALHKVSPADTHANGFRLGAGEYEFETIDPMYFLPIAGAVKSVALEGRWQLQDAQSTLQQMHLAMLRGHVAAQQAEAKTADLEKRLATTERSRERLKRRYDRTLSGRCRKAAQWSLRRWRRLAQSLGQVRPGMA